MPLAADATELVNKPMDDWKKNIVAVLGDDTKRCDENALRYLAYLKQALKFPMRVTGREDFPWEEPYVFGAWSKSEYNKLKKTNPSYTDIFEIIDLLPPTEHCDVSAQIRRISDKRIFGLFRNVPGDFHWAG